jgi:hypothetical protein
MRGAARFFLAGILSLGCADGHPGAVDCSAAPGKPVTVFVEGTTDADPRVRSFHGVVFGSEPVPGTVPRYSFTGSDGTVRRLAFFDPDGPLPIVAQRPYDLAVEMVMGEPSPGALLLSDAEGLVLAAASDTGLGKHVLAAGPPGFTLRLDDGDCHGRERPRDGKPCFAERVNLILEVTHEGTTVRLGHGGKAWLGAYEVSCHAAERVKYSPRCADAGVLTVSWTIRRVAGASGRP